MVGPPTTSGRRRCIYKIGRPRHKFSEDDDEENTSVEKGEVMQFPIKCAYVGVNMGLGLRFCRPR